MCLGGVLFNNQLNETELLSRLFSKDGQVQNFDKNAFIHVLPTINDTQLEVKEISDFIKNTGGKIAQLLRERGCFSKVSYGRYINGGAADYTLQLYVKKVSGSFCDWGFELYDKNGFSIASENNISCSILTQIIKKADLTFKKSEEKSNPYLAA